MSSPLEQTTNVDVDAVPEVTVQESRAPAGTAGSALPAVGTNAVSEWAMWDPNLWWTDWSLPPDPRPSWEQWFDWVNQLKALTPALSEASQDWQTMIGQLDDSLRTVRAMRTDLAGWTGPSARTMSESLDRLENSLTTKSAAIQDNPARLRELEQTINDAVPPMAALDAEYQQVLQDLNACRQVAERGRPIMLNLATKLLQTGTDLENSVRTDNLAPQPSPPRQVTLTDGVQGPSQQLMQVAGSSNLADPGNVAAAAQIQGAQQPGAAGSSSLVDPGQTPVGQAAVTPVPGVSVSPAGPATADPAMAAQPNTPVTASPMLAGTSAGPVAPAGTPVSAAAPAGMTGPTVPAGSAVAMPGTAAPMAQFMAPPPVAGRSTVDSAAVAVSAPGVPVAPAKPNEERRESVGLVAMPLTPGPAAGASGAVAVPAELRGRTGGTGQGSAEPTEVTRITGVARRDGGTAPRRRDGTLDDEAFETEHAGTGMVTGRARRT